MQQYCGKMTAETDGDCGGGGGGETALSLGIAPRGFVDLSDRRTSSKYRMCSLTSHQTCPASSKPSHHHHRCTVTDSDSGLPLLLS